MPVQVSKEHYDFYNYVDIRRWDSYYYQARLTEKLNCGDVLEIGAGKNVVKNILQGKINYITLDIDPELNPDVIGDISTAPFKKNSFDAVLCFQVLEHFPYEKFEPLLKTLAELSKEYVLLGLPFANHEFSVKLNLPLLKEKKLRLLIPKFYKPHKFDGQHYWEIGKKNYPLKRIKSDLSKIFYIEKYFVPFEFNYHAFFLLKKR